MKDAALNVLADKTNHAIASAVHSKVVTTMALTQVSGRTLAHAFASAVSTHAELPCLVALKDRKAASRADRFSSQTFGEFGAQVYRLAHHFRSIGLVPGDRVMVLAGNCPQTVLVHAAVAVTRLSIVAPYVGESSREIQHEFADTAPRLVVVENGRLLEKFGDLSNSTLVEVVTFRPLKKQRGVSRGPSSILLDTILSSEEYPTTEPSWLDEVSPFDEALVLYTATKRGYTRGVVHTQASMLADIELLHSTGLAQPGVNSACVVPFGHLYPIYMMWLFLMTGVTTTLPSVPGEHPKVDVGGMIQCLRDGDATVIPLVPFFLDLMREEVEKRYVKSLAYFLGVLRKPTPAYACPIERPFRLSMAAPRWNFVGFLQFRSIGVAQPDRLPRQSLSELARSYGDLVANVATTITLAAAIEWHEARREVSGGTYPDGVCQVDYRSGRPLVVHLLWRYLLAPILFLLTGGIRQSIRQACFGKRITDLIVGGSRLFYRTQQFWEALGVSVWQGYGLTQMGITHVERRTSRGRHPEVVGPPLGSRIHQRIDPVTKELWLSSDTMFAGYVSGEPDDTEIALFEGRRWYRTTDKVQLVEPDGTIRIIGNTTRMYNTLGGEKVYPFATSEPALNRCPYVRASVVWGDGQPFNVAIVWPEHTLAETLAHELEVSADEVFGSEAFYRKVMDFILAEVNPHVPLPARVRTVIVASGEFTKSDGFIDPDGSINTQAVLLAFGPILAETYQRQLL